MTSLDAYKTLLDAHDKRISTPSWCATRGDLVIKMDTIWPRLSDQDKQAVYIYMREMYQRRINRS